MEQWTSPQFDEVVASASAAPATKMSVHTATEVVVAAANGLPGTRTSLHTTSAEVTITSNVQSSVAGHAAAAAEVAAATSGISRTLSGLVAPQPPPEAQHLTGTLASFGSELTPPRAMSPTRGRRGARTQTTSSAPVFDIDRRDSHSPDKGRGGFFARQGTYGDEGDGRGRRPSIGSSVASWLPAYNRERLISGWTAWTRNKVFPDADEMKKRVKISISEDLPSNRDLYKKFGLCQRVVRSTCFEWITLLVIATNACWIAIDADMNNAITLVEAEWYFQMGEHVFCAFFFIEWVLRFGALERKSSVFWDRWFLFDTLLAIMIVTETWIMTLVFEVFGFYQGSTALKSTSLLRVIRLFRLMRLSRMVRLMRALPELVFMIRGMLAATRSVVITMVLLFCILYCFGIAFRQLSAGTDMGDEFFGTVPESMYTLLIAGTLLDNVAITVATIGRESYTCACLFFVVILLAALTVMNMLIGVTCEVVSNVARTEKERAAVTYVKDRMWHTLWDCNEFDRDQDGLISKDEFRRLIETPQAFKALRDVGVDVVAMVDLAELIFQSDSRGKEYEKKLNFDEFMEIVLQLRGCNPATVKDIVDLRRFLHLENTTRNNTLARMEERQKLIESRLDSLDRKLDKLIKHGDDENERRHKQRHGDAEDLRDFSRENSRGRPSHSSRARSSSSNSRRQSDAPELQLKGTREGFTHRPSVVSFASAGTFPQGGLRGLPEESVEQSTSTADSENMKEAMKQMQMQQEKATQEKAQDGDKRTPSSLS